MSSEEQKAAGQEAISQQPQSTSSTPSEDNAVEESPVPFSTSELPDSPRFVVALGASAGGLEALESFFDHTPNDTGMAFVVIQHLSPDYKSLMVELLSRHTQMKVVRAEHGMPICENHVYLIPPKTNMTVQDGRLQLSQQVSNAGIQLPIDVFFRSLAAAYGERAIGVILSGTGSDGMRGVRAIKEAGGLVVVQDETQARFDGMPRSAISTGLVDLVVPVEQMPAELLTLLETRSLNPSPLPLPDPVIESEETLLGHMLDLLRQHSNVDFSLYKPATVTRRVERRMMANQIHHFSDYVRLLEQSQREREALYRELLIGVTRFFRDPLAFKIIEERVIPEIFANTMLSNDSLRIWVPACSTGEEAYSLAILFREYCDANAIRCPIKIFATDIDKEAVAFAGTGLYPESIQADITPQRLARFFTLTNGQYQINRSIREMVVFAYQNLVKDPPFTRISLVSCRNLLIYLQPVLQRKALALLTYALVPGGFLFLGSSENLGHLGHQYHTIDSRWKIFRLAQNGRGSLTDILSLGRETTKGSPLATRPSRLTGDDMLLDRIHQELIQALDQICFVVDADFRLLHSYGNTANVLSIPPGRATLDLLRMVPVELGTVLRSTLLQVVKENREVTCHMALPGAFPSPVRIRIRPILQERENLFLIFLEQTDRASVGPAVSSEAADTAQFRHLEAELQFTRENLQATIEELETANEELQATNEELVSANEELQSTNEELQSVNEELQTVNSEYQQKIEELTQLHNDIDHLLRITEVGILFVDENLRIRKFTPAASRILHVIPQDIGRPLEHLSSTTSELNLLSPSRAVLAGATPPILEVRLPDDKYLRVRFLPYLVDGQLRGVVIYFLDITSDRLREIRMEEILNSHPAHLAVLDRSGTILLVNRAWEEFARHNGDPGLVHTGPGHNYLEACRPLDDPYAAAARAGIEEVLQGKRSEFYLEYPCHSPTQRRWFMMRVFPTGKPVSGAIVWHLNITERRDAEERLREMLTSSSAASSRMDVSAIASAGQPAPDKSVPTASRN